MTNHKAKGCTLQNHGQSGPGLQTLPTRATCSCRDVILFISGQLNESRCTKSQAPVVESLGHGAVMAHDKRDFPFG